MSFCQKKKILIFYYIISTTPRDLASRVRVTIFWTQTSCSYFKNINARFIQPILPRFLQFQLCVHGGDVLIVRMPILY